MEIDAITCHIESSAPAFDLHSSCISTLEHDSSTPLVFSLNVSASISQALSCWQTMIYSHVGRQMIYIYMAFLHFSAVNKLLNTLEVVFGI